MDHTEETTPLLSSKHASGEDQPLERPKYSYHIEPVVFLMTFAWKLAVAFVPNLLLKQTCLVNGFNANDCSNLNTDEETKRIEESIQPDVAKILTAMTINSSLVPGVVSLFVLPWSDRYGRKKVICASLFGQAASLGLLGIFATLTEHNSIVSPWIYVIGGIPNALVGEAHTFRMAALCYITDRTDKASRVSRFFVVTIATHLGMLSATFLCSLNFVVTAPLTTIFCSFTLISILLIFTVSNLPETGFEHHVGYLKMTKDLFSLQPIAESVKTCFRPRPFQGRKILWSLFFLMAIYFVKENGTATVFYLFLREKFDMTLQDFSALQTVAVVSTIVESSIGLFSLKKFFDLADTSLAVVAVVSTFVEALILMTATSTWVLYLALIICSLKSLSLVVFRSLISSQVPNDEIGKIFSFNNFFDSAASMAGSAMYTFVYSSTLLTFPGAFCIITMTGCIVSIGLIFKFKTLDVTRVSY